MKVKKEGKVRLFVLLFFAVSFHLFAQTEVDEVRLVYDPEKVLSNQVAFTVSKDGSLMAFAYEDGTIRILDASLSKFIHRSKSYAPDIFDIYFVSNQLLMVVNKETGGEVVHWRTGKVKQRFTLPEPITSCNISRSGSLAAIGDKKGNILIWDIANGREKLRFKPFRKNVFALDIHPEEHQFLAHGAEGGMSARSPITIYEINSGRKIREVDRMYILGFVKYDETGERIIYQGQTHQPKIIYDAYFQKTHLKVYNVAQGRIMNKSKVGFSLKANVFTDGLFYNNTFMGVTIQNAFEARDLNTGERLFTTLRDKSKLKAFAKLMRRSRIHSLSKPGLFLVNYNHETGKQHNMNLIFDATRQEILGYLYTNSNEDFAIVSRDGRSYGTTAAFENVFWSSRRSSKRVSLESAASLGFTPRLLSLLTELDQDKEAFEVDNFIEKQPTILILSAAGKPVKALTDSITPELTSGQKNIQVTIEVSGNQDEVEKVKLFHNAKLSGVLENSSNGKRKQYVFDATLTNSLGQENYFYAVAESKSGLDSEKAKLVINYKGSTDEAPNLYLFTIGINAYKNQRYNLNYANADADAFKETIATGSAPIFKNVYNYELRDNLASRSAILSMLEEISGQAKEQDMFVFYYAGHGAMSTDRDEQQEFYLIPFDVTQIYGKQEGLIGSALSASDIQEASTKINAQKQVYFLDACQSAGLLETVSVRGVAEEKAIAQLARSTGTFWITSTGTEQYASEFSTLGHGVFTFSLLEGISGKADGGLRDQKITVRELVTYVEDRVPQLTEEYKGKAQYPTTFSYGNDFPMVIVNGEIE